MFLLNKAININTPYDYITDYRYTKIAKFIYWYRSDNSSYYY